MPTLLRYPSCLFWLRNISYCHLEITHWDVNLNNDTRLLLITFWIIHALIKRYLFHIWLFSPFIKSHCANVHLCIMHTNTHNGLPRSTSFSFSPPVSADFLHRADVYEITQKKTKSRFGFLSPLTPFSQQLDRVSRRVFVNDVADLNQTHLQAPLK